MLSAVLPLAALPDADTPDIEVSSAAAWAGLGLLVMAMLAIDLRVFARHHAPRLRESAG